MKLKFISGLFISALAFCSCNKKPSEAEISKKILLEYVCPDNAKVQDLKILDSKETESLFGLPALQFTVSGDVEWTNGCDEVFGNLPAGYKEKFDRKTVTLVKSDKGWQ